MRRIVAATGNAAKVAELARLVAGVARVAPAPHDISPKTNENEGSIETNATAKAAAWSQALGRGELVVATDGGLLIPALGSAWEPARTRRFAGEAVDDVARAEALLRLAARLTGAERRIGWQEALAVARDGAVVASWVAESPEGLLADVVDRALVEAGRGFWIPALWICPEYGGRRLAELTPAERATRADHWTALGMALRDYLSGSALSRD